jgi:hypothetical protein
MTGYRNKYLEMLKAKNSKSTQGRNPQNPQNPNRDEQRASFEGFEGSQVGAFSEFSPPLDAEGVPCGVCPNCRRGEFWRRPKYHPDHNRTGWICWFCWPPPHRSGPCDFCGVPDQSG